MWQSFNSKHASAHINRVIALERAGLNKKSFNSLVYGTSNSVPVRKLDTPRLVSKWRADEYLTGTTFRSSEEDQPKVVKRHLLKLKSLTFLLSKEEALANYTRVSEAACYNRRHS